MRVEWSRSVLAAPPIDDAGEPELIERLRAEIRANGPITFARFMERALYEPALGYYAVDTERPTRAGDFLTAPELHPIFGHALARQLDELWRRLGRPEPFTVREYGAGQGTLFRAIIDGLRRAGSGLAEAVRYQLIDLPAQQAAAQQRLADAGHATVLESASAGQPFTGCALANEFVDALPVQRLLIDGGRLRELYVDWADGRLVEVAGEPSDDRLSGWFANAGIELVEGQRAEVNLAMLDWIAQLADDLERGCALVIDYGAAAADLYGPGRPTGSLRAFRGQHVSSDVLAAVGHQDITAHVDFEALEHAARGAGMDVLGRTRQAEFLLGCGLDELYVTARAEADTDWESALTLRSAVRRLLDPQQMGGYLVTVLGHGVERDPPLSGLAHLRPAPG